jgi:CHAT domain-containing protein
MVRFYRALIVEEKSAVAALRDAQLQMLEDPAWKSPFYWAAFIVQGDWLARGELEGE